jgi:hypothetical protein
VTIHLSSFVDELEKIALTRSVKEWRASSAAGDTAGANQIAQGSAQLGLKPRYLQDISMGGEEAGVDKMMGHAGAAGLPSTAVRGQSPASNTMTPTATGPAQNADGLIARKLYKPDSTITRGEFTPQLLEQKQKATDMARGLSPEAKSMVPAMYGHETHGAGGLQRSTSMHEYVPGTSDLRGVKGEQGWSNVPAARQNLEKVRDTVLNPMAAKGHTLGDTISETGTNYGNVVNSPQGPKVLDFLPKSRTQLDPTTQSFGTYAPTHTEFAHKVETAPGEFRPGTHGSMGQLRKEVFNPQMNIQPASPAMQDRAQQVLMGKRPGLASAPATSAVTPPPANAVLTRAAGPQAMRPAAHVPTMPTAPVAHAAVGGIAHAPTSLATHMPSSVGRVVGTAERAAATRAPGLLRAAGGALSHL